MLNKRFFIAFAFSLALLTAGACTSAVVSGKMTRNGRPLLWKHRDTGTLDNFVKNTAPTDSTFGYVALYNAYDKELKEAWIGMNDQGFAVMNTASYNLMPDTASYKDREGYVMTAALKRCQCVEDFAHMLDSMPKPLGVQANFGVIDANGNGGYFETDDYQYRFFPIDESSPVIIRTNFSVSGGEGGLGIVRYQNACQLIDPHIAEGDISPELFTEELSRSFYYAPDDTDKAASAEVFVYDNDFIPRYSTSASVVIEGINNVDEKPVMWTALGYPPCTHVEPVSVDCVPSDLLPESNGHAKRCDEAMELKRQVFTTLKGKKGRYIKMKLLNEISSRMRQMSLETYKKHRNQN